MTGSETFNFSSCTIILMSTAASITTAHGIDEAAPKQIVPFIANRPFVYIIKEQSTNAILFMGVKNQ
ncbi:MAG: serpin family protein [Bacteroidales bacterium]|nr:serpin family protein [Bacteroidales bacterium]MDD4671138.1 serpin family protein [Bacteroidales bacterium]